MGRQVEFLKELRSGRLPRPPAVDRLSEDAARSRRSLKVEVPDDEEPEQPPKRRARSRTFHAGSPSTGGGAAAALRVLKDD